MFKLTGTIKVINPTKQVSEKFSMREFVVTENSSMYPQDISFQASQDKCTILDAVKVGDQVEVSFNLRGKSWTNPQGETKYFNTLDAWKVDLKTSGASPQEPQAQSIPEALQDEEDDLPF